MNIVTAMDIVSSAIRHAAQFRSWLTSPVVDFLHSHPATNLLVTIMVPAFLVAGIVTVIVAITFERSGNSPMDARDYTKWNYATDNPWVDIHNINRRPAHADSYDEWAINPWEVNPWEPPHLRVVRSATPATPVCDEPHR